MQFGETLPLKGARGIPQRQKKKTKDLATAQRHDYFIYRRIIKADLGKLYITK
jgi:hypothetical protein